MFSGIVEAVEPVLNAEVLPGLVRLQVQKPIEFNDLKIGDSIAVDGVCLTVEGFTDKQMTFALASETLQVLKLTQQPAQKWLGKKLNLERSLKFGDRIHGHLVTGHVDSLGQVASRNQDGESLILEIEVQKSVLPFLWKKGSVTLNGTSLTVNTLREVADASTPLTSVGARVGVCLIPETLKRTNLGLLQVGDSVTVEPDYMARAMVRRMELQ